MLGAEAALQAYVELLVLLGIRSIDGGHEILQGPLEGNQLLKGIAQKAVSPLLVLPTQVIHVDNQPVLVVTNQLPNFALINSLVFLIVQEVQVVSLRTAPPALVDR